jgi:hypothetical protein
MLHFFEVEGALVRRWVPGRRRVAMEVWNGDGWTAYSDMDNVSRRGQRLNHEQALALLRSVRERTGTTTRFSDEEAGVALSSRQRRA